MTGQVRHLGDGTRIVAALAAAAVVVTCSGPASGAEEFDPATGYRVANYRSPVTRAPQGGTQIDLAAVDRLRQSGAVLVDVMPARAGFDPTTGAWRLVEPRQDIPGSTWLPDVGHGRVPPRIAAYFAGELRTLTGGNLDRPLIFYCLADCWMSWNAVKRAASLGYRNVNWFSEGTDGWAEAGRPLVEARPPPVPATPSTRRPQTQ